MFFLFLKCFLLFFSVVSSSFNHSFSLDFTIMYLKKENFFLYSQQLSLHITQVHHYSCTKAGEQRKTKRSCVWNVLRSALFGVPSPQGRRGPSFRKEKDTSVGKLPLSACNDTHEGQSGGTRRSLSRADCCTWGGDEWRRLFSTCQPSLPFTFKRSSANHGIKYTWKIHFHHFSSLTNTS